MLANMDKAIKHLLFYFMVILTVANDLVAAYDGCMIRYGRRGCHKRILTGVLVTCDGRRHETTVPQNLPPDAVYLSLVNFRLDRLQRSNFTKFRTVECMTIMDSGIQSIAKDAFSGMDALHELVLSNTRLSNGYLDFVTHPHFKSSVVTVENSPSLEVVNITATKNLRSIQALRLNNNRINVIGGQIFTELRNAEEVDLSNNQLVTLDWAVLNEMTKLNKLHLSGNRFQTIPDSVFSVFFAVKELTLGDNPLHCNCRLKWLREFYDIAVDKILDFESVTCASPNQQLMAEVPAERFVCSKASKPVIYWKKIDPFRYEINCSSVGDPAPKLTLWLPGEKIIISPPSDDLSKVKTSTPQILTRPGPVKCEAANDVDVTYTEEMLPQIVAGGARQVKYSMFLGIIVTVLWSLTIR